MLPAIEPARKSKLSGLKYVAVFRSKSLTFTQRVVYSYLAWRDRLGLGASAREIAEATGLPRRRAIPDALKGLQDRSLIEKRGRSWHALKPPDGIFSARRSNSLKHWSDGLQSFKFYIPAARSRVGGRRFSTNHAAVFSLAYSMWQSDYRTCRRQIGQILGLNRSTVFRHLRTLEQSGLLTVLDFGDRMSFNFPDFEERHRALFRPSGGAENQKIEKSTTETYTDPDDAQVFEFCREAGLHAAMIPKIVAAARRIDLRLFRKCAHDAHVAHRFRNGNDQYGALLLHKLKEIVAAEEKARRKEQAERAWQLELERRRREGPSEEERLLEAEIQADLFHPRHGYITEQDITARVAVDVFKAIREMDKMHLHLRRNHSPAEAYEILQRVLGYALARPQINARYLQEPRAPLADFQAAINEELAANNMPPLYDLPKQMESRPTDPDPEWAALLDDESLTPDACAKSQTYCWEGPDEDWESPGHDFGEGEANTDDQWQPPGDDPSGYSTEPIAVVTASCHEAPEGPVLELDPEFLKDIGLQ